MSDRPHDRLLVPHRADEAARTPPNPSTRPTGSRPRRVRPQRRPPRDGGDADDLGHPGLGERRQGPEPRADPARRPAQTSRRPSPRATPAAIAGYPFVRYYSVWNEPNLQQFLAPQYNRGGQAGRAADLRGHLPRRVRRHQGGEPRMPSSASARRPPAAATATSTERRAGDGVARPLREGSSPSRGRRSKFDAWSHHPYPTTPSADADAEGPLAERDAPAPARVRRRARTSGSSGRRSRSGSPSTATRRSRPSRAA